MMQVAYWASYCALNGYAAVFLEDKGFSAGQTGILMAVGNALAAVLQPVAASRADRGKRISMKEVILLCGAVSAAALGALFFTGGSFAAVCTGFLIATVFQQIIQPLMNALGMYFMDRGERLNFGAARGIGSAGYAVSSYVIGSMTERIGVGIIPLISGVMSVVYLLITLTFQMKEDRETSAERQNVQAAGSRENETEDAGGMLQILREKKNFTCILTGIVFFFIFHFMTNTYIYQMIQWVGGNKQDMGTAVFVAAMTEIPMMAGFSRLVKKFSVEELLRFAAVCWVVRAIVFCFCTNVTGIYGAQLMQLVTYALYIPAGVYYANQEMDEHHKVQGQAMVTVAFTVGSVFGNLLGGRLIDSFGVPVMLRSGVAFAAVGLIFFFLGTADRKNVAKPVDGAGNM